MLPLFFPRILVLLLMVAIPFAWKKKWIVAIVLIVFAVVLNCGQNVYFRIWPLNDKGKGNTIKVMSFNIDGTKDDFCLKVSNLYRVI